MVLNDEAIRDLCENKELVSPYESKNVQPASIDLRLGREFRKFPGVSRGSIIDMKDPVDHTESMVLKENESFLIKPKGFALAVTKEKVKIPPNMVGRIEGKSSLGRLGLMVHVTAGFIDPGFEGRVTLEICNLLDANVMILRPDMLICQMSFTQMNAPAKRPYSGRYQGAESVQSSRYPGAQR